MLTSSNAYAKGPDQVPGCESKDPSNGNRSDPNTGYARLEEDDARSKLGLAGENARQTPQDLMIHSLRLDELKQSFNNLTLRQQKEMNKVVDFAKTYIFEKNKFFEETYHKTLQESDMLFMKMKMTALRDEFIERAMKIGAISQKIRELNVFKQDIEQEVRDILTKDINNLREQQAKMKMFIMCKYLESYLSKSLSQSFYKVARCAAANPRNGKK